MAVRLESNGRELRSLRGPWVDHRTDHTGRVHLRGLAPGRRYDATIWFTGDDGAVGQTERVSFSTAPIHAAPTSLVWSGDTCGQGFGINEELGGLTTYAAIHRTQPDLFVHCGDTIYADLEIPAVLRGGVRPRLAQRRQRRRREGLRDAGGVPRPAALRAPGPPTSARCTPTCRRSRSGTTTRRATTGIPARSSTTTATPSAAATCSPPAAAARGRSTCRCRSAPSSTGRGDGYASGRIYRKVPRGQHLDLFVLDMRSYRGANDTFRRRAGRGSSGRTRRGGSPSR